MVIRKAPYIGCAFLVLGTSLRATAAPEAQPATRPSAIKLTLIANSPTVRTEEPPDLSIRFENTSDSSVTVMKAVDGSTDGWRAANYIWYVEKGNGDLAERRRLGRCGNTDALRMDDFVRLESGGHFDVTARNSFLMPPSLYYDMSKPGIYRLRLTYDADPARRENGMSESFDVGIIIKLHTLAATRVTSNVLLIRVEP